MSIEDRESKKKYELSKAFGGGHMPLARTSTPISKREIYNAEFCVNESSYLLNNEQFDSYVEMKSSGNINSKSNRNKRFLQKINHLYEKPKFAYEIVYHVLVSLIITSSILITFFAPKEKDNQFLEYVRIIFEIAVLLIYVIEVLLIFWSCKMRSKYASLGRIAIFKTFHFVCDVITIVSTAAIVCMLLVFSDSQSDGVYVDLTFFFLKALQILRVSRLERYFGSTKLFLHVVHSHRHELFTACVSSLLIFMVTSIVVYFLEVEVMKLTGTIGKRNFSKLHSNKFKPTINSIPEAFYFAVITFLTIGYGDYVPQTTIGKIFVTFSAFVGVAVVSLPSSIIGSAFALHTGLQIKKQNTESLHSAAASFIQKAWKLRCLLIGSKNVSNTLRTLYGGKKDTSFLIKCIYKCQTKRKVKLEKKTDFKKKLYHSLPVHTENENFDNLLRNNDKKEKIAYLFVYFIYKLQFLAAASLFKKTKREFEYSDFVSLFERYKDDINNQMLASLDMWKTQDQHLQIIKNDINDINTKIVALDKSLYEINENIKIIAKNM